MYLFSPVSGGRGGLVVAAAASLLLHTFLLLEWRGWELLPVSSRERGAFDRVMLAVLVGSDRAPQPPSSNEKVDEQVLASPVSDELLQKQLSGDQLDEQMQRPVFEEYLTRDRISVSAQPLSDISIPWPPGLPVMGVKSAVFTIFIDEMGHVRDVVPDGHTLSPVMEEVARNAFLAASFRPALLNGRAVKSIKRIEVEFEFLPVQEPNGPGVVSKRSLLQ